MYYKYMTMFIIIAEIALVGLFLCLLRGLYIYTRLIYQENEEGIEYCEKTIAWFISRIIVLSVIVIIVKRFI